MKDDFNFWGRIQRTLDLWSKLLHTPITGRDAKKRKATFFIDQDIYHQRLELLRELYFTAKSTKPPQPSEHKETFFIFFQKNVH